MNGKTERHIFEQIGKKGALLFGVIDPLDYKDMKSAVETAVNLDKGGADLILIGGSTGVQGEMLDAITRKIKELVSVPVVLFPGNIGTVTKYADAIYFMSMLNSRNPYWISGAQMLAGPTMRMMGLEALSTAYVVVEPGGTVGYVGDANKLPRDKAKIAAAYALGAQYMGFHFFITDVGSASKEGPVPVDMVRAVAGSIDKGRMKYVVAGGIRTPEQARAIVAAGADIVQVGTAFEEKNAVENVRKMVSAVREGVKLRKQ